MGENDSSQSGAGSQQMHRGWMNVRMGGSTQKRPKTVPCRFRPNPQPLSKERIWGKPPRLPPLAPLFTWLHTGV